MRLLLAVSLALAATVLALPSQGRVTNVKCTLVPGLTLPELGGGNIPSEEQVAQPCSNRPLLMISEATKNDPVLFDSTGKPKIFPCIFLGGTLAQGLNDPDPINIDDSGAYTSALRNFTDGALPALDAACGEWLAVAYRGVVIPPFITQEEFARVLPEANEDILQKVKVHMDEHTILIGHSQGALQACQLIRGNNLSRRALPVAKVISLSLIDYAKFDSNLPAVLAPTGLTPINLCPQTGVLGSNGRLIPVVYLDNSRDELFGVTPFTANTIGIGAIAAYNLLYGQSSFVDFITGPDNTATPEVEGLGLTESQYRAAFTEVIEDQDQCPTGDTTLERLGDSYHAYTLFCGQTSVIRELQIGNFLARTPHPTQFANAQNQNFNLVGGLGGPSCLAASFQTTSNPVTSAATIHPDGTFYFTSAVGTLPADQVEPTEVAPFCHIFKSDQAIGVPGCAAPNDVGYGARTWGPLIDVDGTIYVADLDQVYALNPNNSIKWKRSIAGDSQTGVLTTTGALLIATQGLAGTTSAQLNLLDRNTGLAIITPTSVQTLGGYGTSPAIGLTPAVDPITGDILLALNFADGTGAILSVAIKDGQYLRNWSFDLAAVPTTAPVVNSSGLVIIHNGSNGATALSRQGLLAWETSVGPTSLGSPAHNPVTGVSFFATSSGLTALDRLGGVVWSLSSTQFSPTTLPMIAENGYLYALGLRSAAPVLAVIDQGSGAFLQDLSVSAAATGFSSFNKAGELFIAQSGTTIAKYIPADPASTASCTVPSKPRAAAMKWLKKRVQGN